jgi:arylsulfatase A-like enzyme
MIKPIFISLLLTTILSCKIQQKLDHKKKPNVIIIYTDDMNFENIAALGGNVLTPNIDNLITEGVQFTNFRAISAVCSPSRFNLLTGKYASHSKSLLKQFPTSDPAFLRWNVDIDKGERTMAHIMKEHGYFTGMVGKYHNFQNEEIQDQIPSDADASDPEIQKRIKTNYNMLKSKVQKTSGFDYVENVYINNLHALALPKSMQHHNMDWITSGALDFLDKTGNKPFFLYFPTTLPHEPAPVSSMFADERITPAGMLTNPPSGQPSRKSVFERIKANGLKEEAAPFTWLDDAIGTLIEKLKEKGVLENTIIVFASDHGGNRAKMTCYEKGVNAPAAIYWKDHFEKGKIINSMTANIDISATIYDLCGIKIKNSENLDGKSLVPLITNKQDKIRESLFLEITYSKAVVTDEWKYIAVRFPETIQDKISPENNNEFNQEGTKFSKDNLTGPIKVRYDADELYPNYFDRDQLYNLKNDPNELINLANNPKYNQKLDEMKILLSGYVVDFPHSFGEFSKKNL